jgi:outer membrane protein TolC
MRRWQTIFTAIIPLTACLTIGCLERNLERHYLGDAELQHYKHEATSIDYADVHEPIPDTVRDSSKPRTLGDRQKDELWDLKLITALHTSLSNNKIIQSGTVVGIGAKPVLMNPNGAASVLDPAIQETGVLFGGRGVEAALADFDAQFTTSMMWGRDETVQNNPFTSGGLAPGRTLVIESGTFRSQLQKQLAYGGTFRIGHDWDYAGTNSPLALFQSSYRGNLRAEYRHPLWAAAGAEFTRIAGPQNPNFGSITGVSQGVVIARINNDISLANFEAAVRNGLRDVESAYWNLYLQYRLYDTAVTARASALRSWRDAKAKLDLGGGANPNERFTPADEAQARDRYYETRAGAETALNNLYVAEINLRRLMGLAMNDGRIIRPTTEPTTAPFIPDWRSSIADALTHRLELRRQGWSIKSLELQLIAAKSLTHPRFDFVSAYRRNGFGDDLFARNDSDPFTRQGLASAYETVAQGAQDGWNLGFEFSVPIGFRSALAQVRNYELRLAKARQVLALQEREISHDLALAFQDLAAQHATAKSNFHRMNAARDRVRLVEIRFKEGDEKLDLVLRAQSSEADAERAYYNSLVEYNKAIASYHFATGQLLAYNNVHLSEGEWNPAAYEESMERAWARSHGIPNKLLHEEPAVFALPGYTPKVDLDAGANPFGNDNHTPESDAAPLLVPQPEGERQLPDDDSTSLVEPSGTAALNDVAPIAASAGASSQALLPLPENLPEVRTSSRPAVTDIPLLQPAPFNDIE